MKLHVVINNQTGGWGIYNGKAYLYNRYLNKLQIYHMDNPTLKKWLYKFNVYNQIITKIKVKKCTLEEIYKALPELEL